MNTDINPTDRHLLHVATTYSPLDDRELSAYEKQRAKRLVNLGKLVKTDHGRGDATYDIPQSQRNEIAAKKIRDEKWDRDSEERKQAAIRILQYIVDTFVPKEDVLCRDIRDNLSEPDVPIIFGPTDDGFLTGPATSKLNISISFKMDRASSDKDAVIGGVSFCESHCSVDTRNMGQVRELGKNILKGCELADLVMEKFGNRNLYGRDFLDNIDTILA